MAGEIIARVFQDLREKENQFYCEVAGQSGDFVESADHAWRMAQSRADEIAAGIGWCVSYRDSAVTGAPFLVHIPVPDWLKD